MRCPVNVQVGMYVCIVAAKSSFAHLSDANERPKEMLSAVTV